MSPVLRAGQGLLFGACCALIIWVGAANQLFQTLERSSGDTLFLARGVVFPSPDIVIVKADDATILRFQNPIPRHYYGKLIDDLTRAGAKTIAFDVLFPTASGSKSDDDALIAATKASKHVVHAVFFSFEAKRDPSRSVALRGNATSILPRFRIPGDNTVYRDTVWGSAALPALQQAAVALGHVNAPPEDDGVLRRIPNVLRFRSGQEPALYPSLALAAAAHYLGVKPQDIRVRNNEIILSGSSETRHIPVDPFGQTWVNWIGGHDSFQAYSMNDVLDGLVPASQFKNKLVLIGITAAGSTELHPTPFSKIQPAVELQANAIDDILMKRSLRNASITIWLLLLLSFPCIIGAATMTYGARASGLLTLASCTLLWLLALLLLSRFYWLLPVAMPILAALSTWAVCIGFRQYEDAQQLRLAEERYALAVRGANDGLWDWDLKSNSIYYSPRWKAMVGYNDSEIGDGLEEWHGRVHPDDLEPMKAQLDAHLRDGVAHFESQHRMRHRDGRWVWVLSRGLRVKSADGKSERMAGSQSDITSQVEANEQLERNAFYDSLTGLPNRALFMNVLERALARMGRVGSIPFAVLFLDLDRFKLVNDSLGHASGDDLLVGVARRIESCLRPGDIAARLGGDEFTILLEDIGDVGGATQIAERIQQNLSQSFAIGNQEIFPTSSVGIAISSPSYRHADDLLRDADTAMYRAKSLGRSRHAVFDDAMHAHSLTLLRLETDLRRALERQDFLVYYQPIVVLETGVISGFEALVRWKHPERGMVPPGEFIEMAEETGLIIPLDHLVLREACTQVQHWQSIFPDRDLTISVNLSSKQFGQADLVEQIRQTLEDTRLSAHSLKLEITEGVLMNNPESAAVMLHQLRDLGIRLSIDDFGTGYSSLSYLHRFPLDTLKVDQSFVRRMGDNGENSEIVRTIVTLAQNLDMDVIAEGVETQSQMNQLRSLMCDYGQGYLFSRPVNGAEAEALLVKGTSWSPHEIVLD